MAANVDCTCTFRLVGCDDDMHQDACAVTMAEERIWKLMCGLCKEKKFLGWFSKSEQKRPSPRCRPCKNRVNTPVIKQKKSKTLSIFVSQTPTAKLAAVAFRAGAAKVSAISTRKPALWRRYYLLEEQMMKAFNEMGAK